MVSNVLTPVGEIEAVPQTAGQATCCHHWIIEAPHDLFSKAECKHCHEEKTFRNSMRGINPMRQFGSARFVHQAKRTT